MLKLFCNKHPNSAITNCIATEVCTKLPANARLCKGCYDENAIKKDELDKYQLGRKFSTRNGFGPFPLMPSSTTPASTFDPSMSIEDAIDPTLPIHTLLLAEPTRQLIPQFFMCYPLGKSISTGLSTGVSCWRPPN